MSVVRDRSGLREQVSAGGVAFREDHGEIQIVIVLMASVKKWQLPKGIIDPGESAREAALREVREEGGIETEFVREIGRTEYSFSAEYEGTRHRIHKFVHWFLLKYLRGDVEDHDHEVDEACWVTVEDALRLLEFKNERKIVERAVSLIAETAITD